MALNFPDSPTLNQVYSDTTSGFSYQWDGAVWQSYTPSSAKNITILDDISGSFDGSTQTFALTVSSVALSPANEQQLRVVLGGIVQDPANDYTVSSSNITFTTAPTAGLDCSIVSFGTSIPLTTVSDGTVTPAKLSTGGPYWDNDGNVVITGTGTTSLIVNGNARVTGILTIGTSSITLDGTNNQVVVGSAVSIHSGGINVGSGLSIHSGGINLPGLSINSSGIIISGNSMISGVGIQSAGVSIGYGITSLNFVGTGNTFAINGNTVDISISGGGGGTSSQWVTTAAGINTSSKVGVGTTNPQYSLDVDGDINLTGTFRQNGSTFVASRWSSGTGNDIYRLSGDVGIGTTNPQYSLDVLGDINFTGTFRQNGSAFVASRWTAGSGDNIYRLNGDIGIGVESPTAKLDVNGVIKDANGNVRAIPNNDKTSGYTLTANDIGELINITTGGVTVPASVFSAGNSITIYNNSGSSQTITQGSGATLRLAGTSTTGNRTLALRGIATVMCVGSNDFVISGAGLS
jgi:hypothetical protein